MPYIELINTKHKTSHTLMVEPDELNQLKITPNQACEARRRLCPDHWDSCNCSGAIGANEALHYDQKLGRWFDVDFALDTTGTGWFVLINNEPV